MSVVSSNFSFLFYVNTSDYTILDQNARMNDFTYPIILDKENKINEMNHFPSHPTFHTFLLDENDKVILAGNPIDNSDLKELCKQQITN